MMTESRFSPEGLTDEPFVKAVKAIMPGAGLVALPSTHEVAIQWYLQVRTPISMVAHRESGIDIVTRLAEQARARAIRELGLEPILEGLRAEVREFRESNRVLTQVAAERAKRIVELEERLAEVA